MLHISNGRYDLTCERTLDLCLSQRSHLGNSIRYEAKHD
jgi:hypothetical protein